MAELFDGLISSSSPGGGKESSIVWAPCVKRCGYYVCSYSCGLVLQNCPCSGSLDGRRMVGFCSYGACHIVPWQLMLMELIPINIESVSQECLLPGVLFLWPDVPSLCHKD